MIVGITEFEPMDYKNENGAHAALAPFYITSIYFAAGTTTTCALLQYALVHSIAPVVSLVKVMPFHTTSIFLESNSMILFRKGSDLASYINAVFAETYADGTMQEIATTYGVQEALLEQADSEFTASDADSDVAYIQDKGTLIVGVTIQNINTSPFFIM